MDFRDKHSWSGNSGSSINQLCDNEQGTAFQGWELDKMYAKSLAQE